MQLWQHYLQPGSVEEALAALAHAPGPVAVIAGGTDLLLDLEAGRHPPVASLVDITAIPELGQIRLEADALWIGAGAPLARIVSDPAVQSGAACLVEACRLIGGPQVRNVATLGGNVAHALPAGDGTIALLALEARALLASAAGRRWVPLPELFAGPGRPAFDRQRELLVGFRLPVGGERIGTAFQRVMRPMGVAIAILNMAAWVQAGLDGTLQDVRLAIGPAGPRPLRARRTEAALRGRRLDRQAVSEATLALREEVRLRTSRHRASIAYRDHLLPVLLGRTLDAAYRRARAASTGIAGSGQPDHAPLGPQAGIAHDR
jgi:carbon-monoxide dehydrogenase medium subunit